MAQLNRTQLKSLFATGLIVSEAAFIDFIDSVQVSKEGGGIRLDFDNSAIINIPAETHLVNLTVWVDNTQTIKVGSTSNGAEHYSEEIVAGEYENFGGIFSILGEQVYITGDLGIHIKYDLK